MAQKAKPLVLDAWAVLAYYSAETAGATVADAVADALAANQPVLLSVANAGEIWYILARKHGEHEADRRLDELTGMGIQLVAIDWPLARIAARFKKKGRISFADCFAAALARSSNGILLTGDGEFKSLQPEVAIRWLPTRGA